MANKNIFYSWQSDSEQSLNRYFIEDCIKRAIRKLNREDLSELTIDRDTKNVPGFVDIGQTILDKIDKAAIVIGDFTLINPPEVRRSDERPVSNPNVLFEIGYAYGKLGGKPIIGVFNLASGQVEDLPFDLRPKRLMTYRLEPKDDKTAARNSLVENIADAIRQALGETLEAAIKANSDTYIFMIDIWLFGSEIEYWLGVPTIKQSIETCARISNQLVESTETKGFPASVRNLAKNIRGNCEKAGSLILNDENWPHILELMKESCHNVLLIQHIMGFKISEEERADIISKVAQLPRQLESVIRDIELGSFNISRFETFCGEARSFAFTNFAPQHHQFSGRFQEVTLEMRRRLLLWAKSQVSDEEKT